MQALLSQSQVQLFCHCFQSRAQSHCIGIVFAIIFLVIFNDFGDRPLFKRRVETWEMKVAFSSGPKDLGKIAVAVTEQLAGKCPFVHL